MLDVCKTYSVRILNIRIGSDARVGEFTFIGPSGNSMIDYVICSDELRQNFKSFKICERTESSHFHVLASVEIKSLMKKPSRITD